MFERGGGQKDRFGRRRCPSGLPANPVLPLLVGGQGAAKFGRSSALAPALASAPVVERGFHLTCLTVDRIHCCGSCSRGQAGAAAPQACGPGPGLMGPWANAGL